MGGEPGGLDGSAVMQPSSAGAAYGWISIAILAALALLILAGIGGLVALHG